MTTHTVTTATSDSAAAGRETTGPSGRHRVAIVGCGFGGLFAAKRLGHAAVDVTVIDRSNHHLFQPLLYQLATGILSEGDIAPPIRDILRHQPNTNVVLGEVVDVDLDAHHITVDTFGLRSQIPYDSLIVATGANHWSHLLGNMLLLWVFGQAIENAFGSRMYVSFYLVCGTAASIAQYLVDPNSTVLNLGASGAVAGVMGGYLAMYPTSTISIFVWPLSLFTGRDLRVPAWLMLGLWFAVQVILGINGLSEVGNMGGVGYWAHIGGFVTGLVLAPLVRPGVRDSLRTA
jgi:hypothetical protein